MQMKEKWLSSLRTWAQNNDCVQELWLFGSRAKDTAKPDSDIDIALKLMPPTGNTDWALGAYVDSFDEWKAELRAAVDWKVSLVVIGHNPKTDPEVRDSGVRLWARPAQRRARDILRAISARPFERAPVSSGRTFERTIMREIKFRGWTGKEMRYGWGCLTNESNKCFIVIDENDHYPEPVTLMQFTGLHDKNGREIYEADIVSIETYGTNAEVQFEDGVFSVSYGSALRLYANDPHGNRLSVIGNIYENSELLTNRNV